MNKVPHNVEMTIFDVLQTSSVDDFNSVFRTLADTLFLGIFINKNIVLAEQQYMKLLTKGVWTGVG
jgi:hypothetical protein